MICITCGTRSEPKKSTLIIHILGVFAFWFFAWICALMGAAIVAIGMFVIGLICLHKSIERKHLCPVCGGPTKEPEQS